MSRLDIELVDRGLFASRNKAQMEIKNGNIKCDDEVITKSSFLVNGNTKIEVSTSILKYVSRGGLKLEKALSEFNINLSNKIMVDIGSSTGGFSDCALKNGVSKIYAIDVGSNQLVSEIRNNPKVNVYENTDFRTIDDEILNDANLATIDVSFISVTKLLEKLSGLNLNEIICLIKPQFECGSEVSRKYKGVILNKKVHNDVLESVINSFEKYNLYLNGLTYSPVCGGDGNIEYLAYFKNTKSLKGYNIEKVINESFKTLRKIEKKVKNA